MIVDITDMNIIRKELTEIILNQRDSDGCWNVLNEGDKYYPEFNYYVPNYKSTLWTFILLAEIDCGLKSTDIRDGLDILTSKLWDNNHGIFTIGKSHFPIPCLNGNMIYILSYFNYDNTYYIDKVVDFFYEYQRFDDGDYKTPSSYPYLGNKSCYGSHTCYYGIVKLLKGLSFIPKNNRSDKVNELINKCIDFILLHEVCYSSHNNENLITKNIDKITFPSMYRTDFLEFLWILRREEVKSIKMDKALQLLKSKMISDNTWKLENQVQDLITPISKRQYGNAFVDLRAKEVASYYNLINK